MLSILSDSNSNGIKPGPIQGEAAEFDTRVPHSMSATGSRPAQVLSIFNNEGVRMHTHTTHSDEATASC